MGDEARSLLPDRRRLELAAVARGPPPKEDDSQRSAVMHLVVCDWGQMGVNAPTVCPEHGATTPMNSGTRGRWDRNRPCNLRFWSTRRVVQDRPRLSKLPLNQRILATHRPESSKNVQP